MLQPFDPAGPGSANRWTRRALCGGFAASASLVATGCASPRPGDYAALGPALDLRSYFNGRLVGHGIVTDRNDRLLERFVVAITGRWQGDTGTLDEQFTYADGRREQRIWHLSRQPDGRYSGRAADVVGTAAGEAAGPALNWRYTLRLPVDGRTWDLAFDDWMFLVDEQVMINRARMSKFGFTVGEVLIAFRRLPG